MDREGYVRAARRRQAEDALAFERDREAMLLAELEDLLAELHGPALDERVFAQMSPDDVGLVQAALDQAEVGRVLPEEDELEDPDSGLDFAFLGDDAGAAEWDEEDADDPELEAARLEAEIEASRRAQDAIGRYLALVDAPPAPADGASGAEG